MHIRFVMILALLSCSLVYAHPNHSVLDNTPADTTVHNEKHPALPIAHRTQGQTEHQTIKPCPGQHHSTPCEK